MSRFSGLISRWMMSSECMYSSPFIRSVKYLRACARVVLGVGVVVQGYLADKKQPPSRTLQ